VDRIPRVGKELDEVVRATEEATNTIMDLAEEIMSADTSDLAAYQANVNDACMKILEACSFQDITRQRVTKVVSTLTFIEERLGPILDAWNPSDEELGATAEENPAGDAALFNGPALAGEGVNQHDVDAIFGGDPDSNEAPDAAKAPTVKPGEGDAALLNAPALPGEGVDQDNVDAMFDGDADATEAPASAPPRPRTHRLPQPRRPNRSPSPSRQRQNRPRRSHRRPPNPALRTPAENLRKAISTLCSTSVSAKF
jgi:hypothetical protein